MGGPLQDTALGVVWGKSEPENGQGSAHLLLGHLLDAAAVGELVFDRYLSSSVRRSLDACSDGRGRKLFALLCGLHDVGKATPAFQMKDEGLAARVQAAGLGWRGLTVRQGRQWHHSAAGACIVRRGLTAAGWSREGTDWVWPLIAGHHGLIPPLSGTDPRNHVQAHGRASAWAQAQDGFVRRVAAELSVDLASLADVRVPRRAEQLTISGLIIMADWIASDETRFKGLPTLSEVSWERARDRAGRAWGELGLRGGWRVGAPAPVGVADLVSYRFGKPAWPIQQGVVRAAQGMPAPGLLIVEAPMGEGKTEAAFVAVEVLARRFGADGVFVGMPTQATADPMFARVQAWSERVDREAPLNLLHGRARFNRRWMELRRSVAFGGVHDGDEYGMGDDYGVGAPADLDRPATGAVAAAEWFFGRKRGLLAPVTVGTIDHLLHAATRTKHVMLRHAGLAGRVVVLDEVHAYDVYMAQFLFEALRWLADAGVPVVLMSATLPPQMRRDLVRAYVQGAAQRADVEADLDVLEEPAGYPNVTSVCVVDGKTRTAVEAHQSEREPLQVRVEVLEEQEDFASETVAAAVAAEVRGRGCALVVCNTVGRAQAVFTALRPVFGDDVVLLHSRFVAETRAERSESVIDQLGPLGRDGAVPRPERLVVVATQVAEQSFDVDVDFLVTDLAPIDLLLQRIGRLHRHQRPADHRPERFRVPRVLVTGVRFIDGRVPTWPSGSSVVYGDHLLVRSAALLAAAAADEGWSIPGQVPALVAEGYGSAPLGPPEWASTAAGYQEKWEQKQKGRESNAAEFLLSGERKLGAAALDGLHERSTEALESEERVAAVVRDGDESVEVVLVRRHPSGGFLTLNGRPLGPTGEAAVSDEKVFEDTVGATIRLPARPELTDAARRDLAPLPGWRDDAWLGRVRALELDVDLSARLGEYHLTYDDSSGLTHTRTGSR
ncbi:CRISPR-associated helicase/endonuclease Cas3 [Frankia sp. CcI49]|nr:CRISPR-associated helicase/endonuclease Cas3 [Frankia sp. CcI49]